VNVDTYLLANGRAWVVEITGLEWSVGIHKINFLLAVDVLVVLVEAFESCWVVVVATVDAVGNAID